MSIDYGSLAAHVAGAIGYLQGIGQGQHGTTKGLEYVRDELMKAYQATKTTKQPSDKGGGNA